MARRGAEKKGKTWDWFTRNFFDTYKKTYSDRTGIDILYTQDMLGVERVTGENDGRRAPTAPATTTTSTTTTTSMHDDSAGPVASMVQFVVPYHHRIRTSLTSSTPPPTPSVMLERRSNEIDRPRLVEKAPSLSLPMVHPCSLSLRAHPFIYLASASS